MSYKPDEHPFQAGLEVALVFRSSYGDRVRFEIKKVAKVLKNGNFRLEGSPQQYRANCSTWSSGAVWTARPTGPSSYQQVSRIELLTDKLREEAAASTRREKFRNLVEKLRGAGMAAVTEAQVATLAALLAEITGEKADG
jgi:hypothetical protein